jgi:uncharacterized protein (TIGR00290 family)
LKEKESKRAALLSWSGGKDSSLSLYELRTNKTYKEIEIKALLTTLTRDYNRVSMHGVRRELLLAQSESIQIPVEEVWIPSKASNEVYQAEMSKSLSSRKEADNISAIVFGDLFLEDIRAYREQFLGNLGLECLFPIWKRDTGKLAQFFIESGFKAIICTVDPKKLDPKFCGKEFNSNFLSEIPDEVDPCGENGEFHTFVCDGPIFKKKIDVRVGKVVERDGFYFADILLS